MQVRIKELPNPPVFGSHSSCKWHLCVTTWQIKSKNFKSSIGTKREQAKQVFMLLFNNVFIPYTLLVNFCLNMFL